MNEPTHADQPDFRQVALTLLRWATGFGLSLLVIWAITAVGTESLYSRSWSASLERNTPLEGSSFNNRYEAWGTTHFGALGMPGIAPKGLAPSPPPSSAAALASRSSISCSSTWLSV